MAKRSLRVRPWKGCAVSAGGHGEQDYSRKSVNTGIALGEHRASFLPGKDSLWPEPRAHFVDIEAIRPGM